MIKILLFALVLVLAGLLFIKGGLDLFASVQLSRHGKTTQGEVLQGDDPTDKSSTWNGYFLQVKFATEDGASYQERARVDQYLFMGVQDGQKITVHYLPQDPRICQAGDSVRLQFGSIFRGFVVLIFGIYLATSRRLVTVKESARRISEQFKTLTLDKFEYVSVEAKDFRHLDLSFYDKLQQYLESKGFRFLDDQQNITLGQKNGTRIMSRYLLDREGTTMAIIYNFVPKLSSRLAGAKSAKVLNLETWLSDGSFVCTSNAEAARKFNRPPSISSIYLPEKTSPESMIETHRDHLKSYLESHPGIKPVPLKTMADVRKAQDEQQRIKAKFHRQTGLTKEELERFRKGPRVDAIYDELTERRERGE